MGTVFHNAMMVQLDPPWVQPGALRVVDNRIAEVVEVSVEPEDEVIDCQGAVLTPGLVNGHTHLYSALAAGMPAPPRTPSNFFEILKYVWWRLDRAHDPESIRCSGLIGALSALRCGTTTLIDHHASPNAIPESLSHLEAGIEQAGCRALLCYETTDRNRPDEARQGLDENRRYIQSCRDRKSSHFAGMVGAHASFTLNDDSLAGCVSLARELNVGIHIHVAEDPCDDAMTRAGYGCGLIERFRKFGLLGVPDTIFAHGTHLSDADIRVINQLPNITMAHNPSSNMNNAVGYAPVAKLVRPPVLGTDGIGSDLWREARIAQFKSHDGKRPLPFGRPLAMLGESARLASKYLGVKLGVLEVGAEADLVLTRYTPATPLTADNLAGHLIYAMGPEFVSDVMVAGVWRLRNGMIQSCDEVAARAESVEIARALHDRMARISCD
ncbi:MAG: putative aminohydrolase SsnA [Phycisphaeraceae bacterium]